jgi:hypothetical protein
VGLGLTWYGVYRGQRLRNELSVQAVDGQDALAISGVTDFDYSHYRTLAKLGLAWQGDTWKAGLSITTPSLGLFGSGKAAYTLSTAGVDANQDGVNEAPTLATGSMEDLEADYRSSWAVGAGASRLRGRTRFYASAEWFAPVERFTVIALPVPSAGAERLAQELGHVVNVGFGAEHVLSGGVSFRIGGNRFTLGASWATGKKRRILDTAIPPESLPDAGLGSEVDIDYSKLTFLLGFAFGR